MKNGKSRRMSRIFREDQKTVIVPVDDSLIFGPTAGLHNIQNKISNILDGNPDAILAHSGVFKNDHISNDVGRIINLSTSTTNNRHTQKVVATTIEAALLYDADCLAVHVNLSSTYEQEMLVALGKIVAEAEKIALPVMAIVYPRKESESGKDDNYENVKNSDMESYTKLLCHCVRVARDLGADFVKTQYSGSSDSFKKVVEAACPIPIVIAGGEFRDSLEMLHIAEDALKAGCKGVSFGRNVFSRADSAVMINAISDIVHNSATAQSAFLKYQPSNNRE